MDRTSKIDTKDRLMRAMINPHDHLDMSDAQIDRLTDSINAFDRCDYNEVHSILDELSLAKEELTTEELVALLPAEGAA